MRKPRWDHAAALPMNNLTEIASETASMKLRDSAEMLPLVYEQLRLLAAQRLASEAPGQTLSATALVHEVYLRIVGPTNPGWSGHAHFFAAAAEAMRRILVENARRKNRIRHGGGWKAVDLDGVSEIAEDGQSDELLALSEALDRLAESDPTAAQIVKLRYFAGMSMAETAKLIGLSERTAERNWTYAKTWLHRALFESQDTTQV